MLENSLNWAISMEASNKKPRNYVKDFDDPQFPHSTLSGYKKGCRCFECKRARADYDLAARGSERKFTKLLGRTPEHPLFPHGTSTGYGHGHCPCEQCRAANTARKLEANKVRARRPEAREAAKVRIREYRNSEVGRARKRASQAMRKARKAGDCTVADQELITLIYKRRPDGYHVDHIIPLNKGGAHHPDNLQYLPAAVNIAKHARLNFECAGHAIRWQDLLVEPSTTIPQGSRGKRPEVPRSPEGLKI